MNRAALGAHISAIRSWNKTDQRAFHTQIITINGKTGLAGPVSAPGREERRLATGRNRRAALAPPDANPAPVSARRSLKARQRTKARL